MLLFIVEDIGVDEDIDEKVVVKVRLVVFDMLFILF